MFMNGKNGYFIRCIFMTALNIDYSPDFFISVAGYEKSLTKPHSVATFESSWDRMYGFHIESACRCIHSD